MFFDELEADEKFEVITLYYSGEDESELVERFGLDDESPDELWRSFRGLGTDEECPYCEKTMLHSFLSRDRVAEGKSKLSIPACPLCGHTDTPDCGCLDCESIREHRVKQAEAEQNKDPRDFPPPEQAVPIDVLDLGESLWLLAFALQSNAFAVGFLRLTKETMARVCGGTSNALPQLRALAARGRVYYDGEATEAAGETIFRINLEHPRSQIEALDALRSLLISDRWPDYWFHEDLEYPWLQAGVNDCRIYLDVLATERNLESPDNVELVDALLFVLKNFSIGQAFNIIWRSARNTSDLRITRKIGVAKSSSLLPGAIIRTAKNALERKYDIPPFDRPDFMPENAMLTVIGQVIDRMGLNYWTSLITSVAPFSGYQEKRTDDSAPE